MKYDIICKNDDKSKMIKEELITKLKGTLDKKNPSFVFSIGGDGTVLDAVRTHIDKLSEVVFIAIHTGNLGFYTEFLPKDIDLIIDELNNENKYIKRRLLEFSVDGITDYALNEVVFQVKHNLFEGDVYINNDYLMSIKGDGVCISTPSGSTAYNKSLKGTIVDPRLNLLQMVVKAPFETLDNRIVSPLVLSEDRTINIKPKSRYLDVSFDRVFVSYQDVKELTIKLSKLEASFMRNKTQTFPKRLKEKFISKG